MKNDRANQLEERLLDFGVKVIRLSGKMPRSYSGQHIAMQMFRSGTSPAPNYGEARGAESRADFVHKLGIALKELNETQIWLPMATRAELLPGAEVAPVLDECIQLARMLNASIQTVRQKNEQ